MPRFSYAVDFVYFPQPQNGIRGRHFEMFLYAEELENPVFVRFDG